MHMSFLCFLPHCWQCAIFFPYRHNLFFFTAKVGKLVTHEGIQVDTLSSG